MRREIRALQKRLGMTMLYVTHDQVEAMTMADQVVLMRAGRIEQDGTPSELYERPASVFTARFVGTPPMNVLPLAALDPDAQWLAAAAPKGRTFDGLAIGVRPESIRISDSGIAAKVAAVEYLGADSLIEARIAAQPIVIRMSGRSPVAPDANVRLSWNAGQTHWFELTSGRRID
jgi:sn-glycerol 3-phosphate transport system ATP-binding protein